MVGLPKRTVEEAERPPLKRVGEEVAAETAAKLFVQVKSKAEVGVA